MGLYLNPSANGFRRVLSAGLYVDKSELIAYTNAVMNSARNLTCFTRPRRFGKSFAAQMLVAYYTRGDDSRSLFETLKIANTSAAFLKQRWLAPQPFDKYLNHCDVIFWDMVDFATKCGIEHTVDKLQQATIAELREAFPEECCGVQGSVADFLQQIYRKTGRQFFIIIDEWDAIFREAQDNKALQEGFLDLLRSLFKSNISAASFLSGAYMTGILPIRRYGTQSALTEFQEFTMLNPSLLAQFVGFTEAEVRTICQNFGADYDQMQRWYDGYKFDTIGHVYSPNSVIMALLNHRFASYWTQTASYESLLLYIEMNFDGLREAILQLLGGHSCRIAPESFENDMSKVNSRDQVLTLLAHLGYLAFDADSYEVSIPNEEIRREFVCALGHGSRPELVKAVLHSDELLAATINGDEETVARLIEASHLAQTQPLSYHSEEALRSVVITAYLSAIDHYLRFEELAGGRGYIDLLFIPTANTKKPALIIELKRDSSPETALSQIKKRQYQQALERFHYHGSIRLIGISYDSKTNRHSCCIENSVI